VITRYSGLPAQQPLSISRAGPPRRSRGQRPWQRPVRAAPATPLTLHRPRRRTAKCPRPA